MTAREERVNDLEKKSNAIFVALMAKKEAHKMACIELYHIWETRLYEESNFANFRDYHRWLGLDPETASAMVGYGYALLHDEEFQ